MIRSEIETGRESTQLEDVAPDDISSIHIQSVVRARMGDRSGVGVLEQFPRWPHEPSRVTGLLGGHRGMRDA